MKYSVHVIPQAAQDLREIHRFILEREGPLTAGPVIEGLKETVLSLGSSPFRGKEPTELQPFGGTEYLQVIAKPYRILYYVRSKEVYVVLIADGRRDFDSLLSLRLRK